MGNKKKKFSQEEMTKYLKTVMDLEASVYTQEEALRDAEEVLTDRKPVKKRVEMEKVYIEPGLSQPKEPVEPIQCSDSYQNEAKLTPLIGVICFIVGFIWRDFGYIFFIVGVLAFIYSFFIIKKAKEAVEDFEANYSQYLSNEKGIKTMLSEEKQTLKKEKPKLRKDIKKDLKKQKMSMPSQYKTTM